ncbi:MULTISPECIES: hypothetical protein [Xenorhabdus]|uniref:hypothetical protein n=1 Tax=Xenorhabdus TaxID=626 RepID=UPI000647A522|nr:MULTISPECIES: hypothetical protein [Xenorhabdus]
MEFKINPISHRIKNIEEYFKNVNGSILEINRKVRMYKNSENEIKVKMWSGMKFSSMELLETYNEIKNNQKKQ